MLNDKFKIRLNYSQLIGSIFKAYYRFKIPNQNSKNEISTIKRKIYSPL